MKILIEKTEEKKEEVWNKLEQWIREHKAVCGETVMQSDSCNLSAPEILSEILDEVIKPRIVWENDLEL